MRFRAQLGAVANSFLRPFRVRLVPDHHDTKPWDDLFKDWIARAKANGIDPNEIGDIEWSDDGLNQVLEERYLSLVSDASVVLELGPGSGRLTRHLIKRSKEVICVDYSSLVCAWLSEYLSGKGLYRIHQIMTPSIPMVSDASVDVVIAHGVFEHFDLEDTWYFLEEFYRVLKPSGTVSFNFDNIMSEGGIAWFRKWKGAPGTKSIFRFHHPQGIQRIAETMGYTTRRLTTNQSRLAHIELEKTA